VQQICGLGELMIACSAVMMLGAAPAAAASCCSEPYWPGSQPLIICLQASLFTRRMQSAACRTLRQRCWFVRSSALWMMKRR
jgi:hypothetical protein